MIAIPSQFAFMRSSLWSAIWPFNFWSWRLPAGDVVITGGLGALGVLLATWSASLSDSMSDSGRVRLLSRSGRAAPGQAAGCSLQSLLQGGSSDNAPQIVMDRCDAALAEEAAYVMGGNQTAGTLLHAAGVVKVCSSQPLLSEDSGKSSCKWRSFPYLV